MADSPKPNGNIHSAALRQIKRNARAANRALLDLDALLIFQAEDPPTSRAEYDRQYVDRARAMNRVRDALALVEEAADEAIERVDW